MRSLSLCGPYTGCTDNCQMQSHEVVEAVFRLPLKIRDGFGRKNTYLLPKDAEVVPTEFRTQGVRPFVRSSVSG